MSDLKLPYKVYTTPPLNFKASVEVSGLFCEYQSKLLFLKRQPHKKEGNTWSIPAGKLEIGEDAQSALIREIHEEIGIKIDGNQEEVGRLYIRHPGMDLIFHMFRKKFQSLPQLDLNLEENNEACWIALSNARKLPLISAGHEVLDFYSNYLSQRLIEE